MKAKVLTTFLDQYVFCRKSPTHGGWYPSGMSLWLFCNVKSPCGSLHSACPRPRHCVFGEEDRLLRLADEGWQRPVFPLWSYPQFLEVGDITLTVLPRKVKSSSPRWRAWRIAASEQQFLFWSQAEPDARHPFSALRGSFDRVDLCYLLQIKLLNNKSRAGCGGACL